MASEPTACPCQSGRSYPACCGPLLEGSQAAPTAEALMRSRYTAYTRGAIGYLLETHAPATRGSVDPAAMARWSRESTWLGLEVLAVERGGEADDGGVVEFRARFRHGGVEQALCERSTFVRGDGRWLYLDGEAVRPRPAVNGHKVGRNDPCPCGSGRKHKKCCG